MREYKGEAFAANKYIDALYLEKTLEDGTIAMNAETTGYVPEVYPSVIGDLGLTLVTVGKIEEALNAEKHRKATEKYADSRTHSHRTWRTVPHGRMEKMSKICQ